MSSNTTRHQQADVATNNLHTPKIIVTDKAELNASPVPVF
jgi:hypothetical protein